MPIGPADFAPYEAVAALALPHVPPGDPAHDPAHLLRVWRNCLDIVAADGLAADLEALAAAALLHDCVNLRKDDPRRAFASRMAADKACAILGGALPPDRLRLARGAIERHSFSAGLAPRTVEDAVLRDADRLDTLGAVGIARLFTSSGIMGRAYYDPSDPLAERRPPDDLAFALDHFEVKLLRLADGFLTTRGRTLAVRRTETMRRFLDDFVEEAGLLPEAPAPGPSARMG